MPSKMAVWLRARPHPTSRSVFLLVAVFLGSLVVGCGSTASTGGSSSAPGVNSATATADAAGNWQTVTEVSGSSTSSGGGTNQDISEQTVTIGGAYRVMAACQGSGSLKITLDPGGSIALQCAPSKQDLVRIAGGDSAPADGSLDIKVERQGNIEWSDVQVQVRA